MTVTHIKYQDTALPTAAADVTLFSSAAAFPPGGSFHLLGQQWYQYSLFMNSAGDGATAVLTGEYSNDKGSTWNTFYTSGTLAEDAEVGDEVYIGLFKDVRFTLNVGGEDLTTFRINQTLHCAKPTSKTSNADTLHNDNAAATDVAVDAP
jgi:S-formylglutathione hydrolase FrmB